MRADQATRTCPRCAESVSKLAKRCPHCRKDLAFYDASASWKAASFVLALLVMAAVIWFFVL